MIVIVQRIIVQRFKFFIMFNVLSLILIILLAMLVSIFGERLVTVLINFLVMILIKRLMVIRLRMRVIKVLEVLKMILEGVFTITVKRQVFRIVLDFSLYLYLIILRAVLFQEQQCYFEYVLIIISNYCLFQCFNRIINYCYINIF